MTLFHPVVLFEAGFAIAFLALLVRHRKKRGDREYVFWGLVWAARVFASLQGSQHVDGKVSDLLIYLALQVCSGLSLMLILVRYELAIFKERLLRHLFVRVSGCVVSASNGKRALSVSEYTAPRAGTLKSSGSATSDVALEGN